MRIAFVALLLIAAGASAPAASAKPKSPVLPNGVSAPPLHAKLLDGHEAPAWAALKGKIVIVDFWASWCTPCLAAFPKFNGFADTYQAKGVEFFSVTYEPTDFVKTFLQKHPLHTTVAIDDDFTSFKAYNAWGIPVAYIFDRRGKLVGAVHPDELSADAIDTMLKGGNPHLPAAQPWSDPQGAEKYFRSLQQELKTPAATTTKS